MIASICPSSIRHSLNTTVLRLDIASFTGFRNGKLLSRQHLVAWIGGVGALSPTRVPGHAMRTYSGRPSSSIRFSTSAAMATSVACRPSVWKRSPSPMTRFQREISALHQSAPVVP